MEKQRFGSRPKKQPELFSQREQAAGDRTVAADDVISVKLTTATRLLLI